MRSEDNQGGGDDTAANGLKLKYCGLRDWRNQKEQTIWDGSWGGWKTWGMCPYGKYIGGARVRYEDNVGNGDDTAMNGIQFNVEIPNFGISHSGITGEWALVASGPQGQISHKIIESTQTTSGTAKCTCRVCRGTCRGRAAGRN